MKLRTVGKNLIFWGIWTFLFIHRVSMMFSIQQNEKELIVYLCCASAVTSPSVYTSENALSIYSACLPFRSTWAHWYSGAFDEQLDRYHDRKAVFFLLCGAFAVVGNRTCVSLSLCVTQLMQTFSLRLTMIEKTDDEIYIHIIRNST